MLEKVLLFSIEKRWFILLMTLFVLIAGSYNFNKLPIDAVPDITNVQVQINCEARAYSPFEVEQRITLPLETILSGMPQLSYTRSISRYGLSQITAVFEDGTDIYFARQLVNERMSEAKFKLPSGIELTMGPISTGLGEIFMWAVYPRDGAKNKHGLEYSLQDLREIQDWIIKPQLRNITGVTEVNTIGGFEKKFQVAPDPAKLLSYNLTLQDIVDSLERNNNNIGSGYIERNGEQYLVRVPGQVKSLDEIAKIVIANRKGVPIYINDVASVFYGKEQRTGAGTFKGKEAVIGTVFMLIGENSRLVSNRVAKKLKEINKALEKEGVVAEVVYNRTTLVDKTIDTVKKNLLEGALLVIAILFLFLGNIRAAIITALVIPISMMITITGMVKNGISGNLMSLGALDFGLIVDGAVIIVESCITKLVMTQRSLGRTLTKKERFETVFSASKEVRQATIFGEAIIIIVYLPIFSLTGIEGKMFHPMAFTVIAALSSAMILSMTFVPAAVALFLGGKISEKENIFLTMAKRVYQPILQYSLSYQKTVVFLSLSIFTASLFLSFSLGKEFMPSLNEGDIALHAIRIPGTSLTQSLEMQKIIEKELIKFKEVKKVFSKIGTAEVASDPMPPNVADTFVMLKNKSEWPDQNMSKKELVAKIEKHLKNLPGNNYEFTQAIQMRFNELISGVRADVAVKIFGDDMNTLSKIGRKVHHVLEGIHGASDVHLEQISGLPVLTVKVNRKKLARIGLNISDVQDTLSIAIGGKIVGKVYEGDRNFDLLVRVSDRLREDIDALSELPILVPKHGDIEQTNSLESLSRFVPLSSIADISFDPRPSQISRENGKRRIVVTANVRGRDLGSFVEEGQQALRHEIKIPSGYWTKWGGQFEQLISATNRLKFIIPLALLLILLLLFTSFGSLKDSLLVFTGVPLALTGGVLALWLRDIPLSISSGVGFIALSGISVLNGLVMITFIRKMREEGSSLENSIVLGAMSRLRPVLMTALVASLGFVPMALATGMGAEVQRPLATVVIGGIVSSTLLTLVTLPALYALFHKSEV